MRGKDKLAAGKTAKSRITPAYAGKRVLLLAAFLPHLDHPRLCGEKSKNFHGVHQLLGSPPPMRGKEPTQSLTCSITGITPAYAGKSV